MYIYFILYTLFRLWSLGVLSDWLLCPFEMSSPFVFSVFPSFLALHNASGSSSIFSTPSSRAAIYPGSPGAIY